AQVSRRLSKPCTFEVCLHLTSCSPRIVFLNARAMPFSYQCARRQCLLLSGRGQVVCNALGCDASFSDFDLGHPGEPDPWRLAPELKFLMRPLHWATQEEAELAPTDSLQYRRVCLSRDRSICAATFHRNFRRMDQ